MKKIIPLMAAFTLLATTPTYATASFTDVQQYDATTQQAVSYLADRQIIKGTTETTFSPKVEIKRGQVVKMLGRYLTSIGKEIPSDWQTNARFRDVHVTTADRELLQYAALVYDEGVFVGNNGVLNASGTLTRENLVLVLSRLAEPYHLQQYVKEQGLTSFVSDLHVVKDEAKEAVQLFNALRISNVEQFNPKGRVQRIHFASFFAKMLQLVDELDQETDVPPVLPTPPVEQPVEPVDPIEPTEPEEIEDVYVVEDGVVEGAEVLATTDTTVTLKHSTFGTATFNVDPIFSELFAQQQMWKEAVATFYVEEDVVTEVSALTVRNVGTANAPVVVNGAWLDGITDVRITSQYAQLEQFDDYYELVAIDAPANAVYTISGGEFELIRAAGPLTVTFTGIISNDVVLDTTFAHVTIAESADVLSLAPTNHFSITVEDGGTIYDVYMPAHITEATVHGYVETFTVNTTNDFILLGTGEVNTVYGEAARLLVKQEGVTVTDVLLSNGVDDVTVQ